jgi:hypothetical protein
LRPDKSEIPASGRSKVQTREYEHDSVLQELELDRPTLPVPRDVGTMTYDPIHNRAIISVRPYKGKGMYTAAGKSWIPGIRGEIWEVPLEGGLSAKDLNISLPVSYDTGRAPVAVTFDPNGSRSVLVSDPGGSPFSYLVPPSDRPGITSLERLPRVESPNISGHAFSYGALTYRPRAPTPKY